MIKFLKNILIIASLFSYSTINSEFFDLTLKTVDAAHSAADRTEKAQESVTENFIDDSTIINNDNTNNEAMNEQEPPDVNLSLALPSEVTSLGLTLDDFYRDDQNDEMP